MASLFESEQHEDCKCDLYSRHGGKRNIDVLKTGLREMGAGLLCSSEVASP